MTGFQRVCALSDLGEDTALHVELDGEPVCVARSGGQVYALRDVCSHADIPLSEGEVENGRVECWLHGSEFELASGKPTGLPAVVAVPTYPVRTEGDDVLVAIEES